jgi:hypothetical protein
MITLPHPILSHSRNLFGIAHLQATLLESLRVTAVGLFWLAALPIAAVLSVAATLYDRLLALRFTALRVPYLRSPLATSPLILKRKVFIAEGTSAWTSGRKQTARD